MPGLFGHCPNSDCTPPLHSNGHSGALYFRTDLSKCHLNFNFHCISAPNHPGKGSDPPNQANAPLNMDNSSQNKCPKPFGQGSRPPPHLGNAQIDPASFSVGLPLGTSLTCWVPAGYLFSVFWVNSCKECHFSLQVYSFDKNLCY